MGSIHARVPMVTLDEQREVQLRNAESEARFWSGIKDMHAGPIDGYQKIAASYDRIAAQLQGRRLRCRRGSCTGS